MTTVKCPKTIRNLGVLYLRKESSEAGTSITAVTPKATRRKTKQESKKQVMMHQPQLLQPDHLVDVVSLAWMVGTSSSVVVMFVGLI